VAPDNEGSQIVRGEKRVGVFRTTLKSGGRKAENGDWGERVRKEREAINVFYSFVQEGKAWVYPRSERITVRGGQRRCRWRRT